MRAPVTARAVAEVISGGEPAIIITPADSTEQRGIVRNHGDGVALGDLADWQQPEVKRDG